MRTLRHELLASAASRHIVGAPAEVVVAAGVAGLRASPPVTESVSGRGSTASVGKSDRARALQDGYIRAPAAVNSSATGVTARAHLAHVP